VIPLIHHEHGHVARAGQFYGRCVALLQEVGGGMVMVQLTPVGKTLILNANEFDNGRRVGAPNHGGGGELDNRT
jgi:hypothetical protein